MELLKVVWQNLNSRSRFFIGKLFKVENEFIFEYASDGLEQAQKRGLKGFWNSLTM